MRYWLMILALAFFVTAANSQDKKKKEDAGKETTKEPGKDSKSSEYKEPSEIGGKSFEQWKAEIKSLDPVKRETAMKTITLFGPKSADAVHDIILELKKHSPSTDKPVDLSVRVNGITALNTIFAHTKDHNEKDVKEAIGVYRTALKDPQVIMKLRAVQGVQYLKLPARDLLPEVMTLARDGATWELRKEAIQVMVVMAPDKKGVPDPKVLNVLKNSANRDIERAYLVRIVAIQGLGMLFKETAYIDYKKALDDPSKEVRLAAVQSLANCGEKAIVDLRNALQEQPNKEVQLMAVQALAVAGKYKVIDTLRKLLGSKSKEIRLAALQAIASLKEEIPMNDTITVKTLNLHVADEKDPIVRMWTHATIMLLTDITKKHMDPILQQINHEEKPVRVQALRIVGMSGDKGRALACDAVVKAVEDKDLEIAVLAIEVLLNLHCFEAIPQLELIAKASKTPIEIKQTIEDALEGFKLLKLQLKKKDAEKKAPEKK